MWILSNEVALKLFSEVDSLFLNIILSALFSFSIISLATAGGLPAICVTTIIAKLENNGRIICRPVDPCLVDDIFIPAGLQ
jgi:hypothetical protein